MTSNTPGTVLITGASRGLGRALAHAFARDAWSLVIDARGAAALDRVREELATITRVTAIAGSIGESKHRARLAEAVREHGGVDVVVNNAGTLGTAPLPRILDYSIDALEETIRINALAPLALVQELRGLLRENACIINVTSDAAVTAYEGWGGYAASKSALEAWSRALAVEHPGLRVYEVDPGDMRTAMHQEAFPGEDISDRAEPEESAPGFLALVARRPPSGRYRAMEQIAVEAP
jgi:NAD(P)-dependent dehydrogenase (short-subunit alcohol dehydrogenase family)